MTDKELWEKAQVWDSSDDGRGKLKILESVEKFAELVRADERTSFYGQDKPAQCAKGCPPRQICEYCQIVEPVKQMIADEREECAKLFDNQNIWDEEVAIAIRARGTT